MVKASKKYVFTHLLLFKESKLGVWIRSKYSNQNGWYHIEMLLDLFSDSSGFYILVYLFFLSFSFSVWRLYFFFILQQIWLVIEKIHGMGKESYFLESLMGLFFKVLLAKRRIRDRYCKIELTIWIIFIYECLQFFFHHSLFILLGPPN